MKRKITEKERALMKEVNHLRKVVADLKQEVEDYKATVEVMSDKELYDTIKNMDENTELFDEEDLNW